MIKPFRFLNRVSIGIFLCLVMVKPVLADKLANNAFFGLDPDYVNKQLDLYTMQNQLQQQQQKSTSSKGKKQSGQTTPSSTQAPTNTNNQTGDSSNSGQALPSTTPTPPPAQTPSTGGDQDLLRGY